MTEPLFIRETPQPRDIVVRGLSVRAETLDTEGRSVEAVLSTAGRVQVFDYQNFRMIEEVLVPDGAEFPEQVVFLESHARWSLDFVLGSIRNIRVEGGKLVGRLFFASGDERVDRAWNLVRQGHVRDVSIGYKALDFVDIGPGQTQVVDGKRYTAGQMPLRITRRYAVREGSLVPIGADEAAKIRSELHLPHVTGGNMNPQLRKYLESLGLRSDANDQQAWDFLHSLSQAQQARGLAINEGREQFTPAPAAAPAQPVEQRSAPAPATAPVAAPAAPGAAAPVNPDSIRQAERDRIAFCRSQAAPGVPQEMVDQAIREGWDEARVCREYLTAVRGAQPAQPLSAAPAIGRVADRERDFSRQNMAGALMQRIGIDPAPLCRSDADRQAWERAMNEGERFMAFSMFDFCREAVRLSGALDPDTGMQPSTQEGFIRAALSTPTLSYAFTSSVNARILARYEEASAMLDFVEMVDVPDFKQNEAISLGKQSGLQKLPRGKTATHATFADDQETFKIARYARQLVIDDQDIIDDRLDVFSTIPDEFALAAARLMPDLVFYLLMSNPDLADGTPVFDNSRGNTATDTFASDKLKLGVTAMRKQKENGVNLNINPQYLLTSAALEFQARELLGSANLIIAGTAGTVTERGSRNVVSDIGLQLRMDARIDNGVTDPDSGASVNGSSTAWFLLSRPFRTIRGAYRAGTGRRPQLRRFTLDRGQYGIGWDIAMDCGAKIIGHRGLYRGNT